MKTKKELLSQTGKLKKGKNYVPPQLMRYGNLKELTAIKGGTTEGMGSRSSC